ncbi:MAG: hypothetical protein ACRC4T_15635 [Cetobacterium sp.]
MNISNKELETQIIDIFNKFYETKIVKEKTTSFTLNEEEIKSILNIEVKENEKGKFYHKHLDDDIFYKFIKRRDKLILIFMRLGSFIKMGCSS